jgi:hypothetical protein
MRSKWLLLCSLLGCSGADDFVNVPGDDTWLPGKGDGSSSVNIASTGLVVDLGNDTAVATIGLEQPGNVALEAGGLSIQQVNDDRGKRHFRIVDGKLLVAGVRGPLVVEYGFSVHDNSDGLLPSGSTVTWPYYCGNLFPCHSAPADGLTFTLELRNVPSGKHVIFPDSIPSDAPPYMLAWAVGDYTFTWLGATQAGTRVLVAWLPGDADAAMYGTQHLVDVVNWYEQTLGPYRFGPEIGSVSVDWGPGALGGMEHHPYFHVARGGMSREETHAHEAAHGWFGDGIRLRCWEDFVLSEGTVSYLAAHSLGKVAGAATEAAVWSSYEQRLAAAEAKGGAPAWPRGCNQIDILKDHLFTDLPYMEGAFFYKDVADAVGADVLDGVFARFYQAHAGQVAGMQDMIDAIQSDTGYDASGIAEARLRRQF